MKYFVVDTNVPAVANGRSEQADVDCVLACVESLAALMDRGGLVLDCGGLILEEYRRNLRPSGEPGLGDKFMKWAHLHQAVETRCEQVRITPRNGSFEEFPADPDLAGFDPEDRKFVAVALGSQRQPIILNAVDPDWWQHLAALTRNGVRVRFLCPQHMP